MRQFLGFATLLIAASPAIASGGLSCAADDEKAKFMIESGVTRGLGSPVFNFRGEINILDKAVADDLRKTSFDGTHLAQYWLDGANLNLHLYRERQGDKPHGYVDLVITTQPGDDGGSFHGGYELSVFDMTGDTTGEGRTISASGTLSCFVE